MTVWAGVWTPLNMVVATLTTTNRLRYECLHWCFIGWGTGLFSHILGFFNKCQTLIYNLPLFLIPTEAYFHSFSFREKVKPQTSASEVACLLLYIYSNSLHYECFQNHFYFPYPFFFMYSAA